jgi:hypothetical protein
MAAGELPSIEARTLKGALVEQSDQRPDLTDAMFRLS